MNEKQIIIDALERITTSDDARLDWENLLSIKFDDQRCEALRQLFWQVSDAFPGEGMRIYSDEGIFILKAILTALKSK